MTKSLFEIVKECDNFPYYNDNPTLYTTYLQNYYTFKVSNHPETLGHIPKEIVQAFDFADAGWLVNHDTQELILGHDLTNATNDRKKRLTALMSSTLSRLIKTPHPLFQKLSSSWRNEQFPIHGVDESKTKTVLLEIERSASSLFGILTSGVQITCYVTHPTRGLQLWIARRSKTKQTYPGMLDNTAAGGLESIYSDSPHEAAVRETVQEASLDEGFVRRGLTAAGAISYYHVKQTQQAIKGTNGTGTGTSTEERTSFGLPQPEIEYVYDLELPPDVTPVPGDGEVEGFYLWDVEEVLAALGKGEFKMNSAVAVVDFLIRRGVVSERTEGVRDFREIVARLHRRLEIGGC